LGGLDLPVYVRIYSAQILGAPIYRSANDISTLSFCVSAVDTVTSLIRTRVNQVCLEMTEKKVNIIGGNIFCKDPRGGPVNPSSAQDVRISLRKSGAVFTPPEVASVSFASS